MIEVAVGEQYKIELPVGDEIVTGKGTVSGMFGVKARIDRKMKGTNFTIGTVRPDTTMGVKVSDFHELGGGAEESVGTSIRKGFIRTCTLFPCSSTP